MKQHKILHIDSNHPSLWDGLEQLGFTNVADYKSSKAEIEAKIENYSGIVIRSRFSIDAGFLEKAKNLKFIARVGAGLENIDNEAAAKQNIALIAAPEGNRNAVGEHALGMLLSLFNNLNKAHLEVKNGQWNREANRGNELDGKTVGIIGYGNMGKAFAKKLRGFDVGPRESRVMGMPPNLSGNCPVAHYESRPLPARCRPRAARLAPHTRSPPRLPGLHSSDREAWPRRPTIYFASASRALRRISASLCARCGTRPLSGFHRGHGYSAPHNEQPHDPSWQSLARYGAALTMRGISAIKFANQ